MSDRTIRVKLVQLYNVGDDGKRHPIPTRSTTWCENCEGKHAVVTIAYLTNLVEEERKSRELADRRWNQWQVEERENGELKLRIERMNETEVITQEIFTALRTAVGLTPGDGVSLLKFVKDNWQGGQS